MKPYSAFYQAIHIITALNVFRENRKNSGPKKQEEPGVYA